jgi:lipopolysaccharide transport system permease protein
MWLYFTGAISLSSESTVASAQLISKVYFPRIIIPVAGVVLPLTDFALGLVVVIGVTLAYGIVPPVQVVLIPLLAVLTLMTALGVGLWFSALNVKYRDIRLLVPFLIQVGLFVTPIVYPFSLVPHGLRPFYALNPMVGVLEAYRWMLFPHASWPGAIILIPLGASVFLLVTGALYYRHAERDFADVV